MQAIDEEINSIQRNKTWELVYLPANKTLVGVKWVYKMKVNEICMIEKYKARLVTKGFFSNNMVLIMVKYSLQ